jgi:16S rRNA (guanine1516-N2)-methyltransferase
VDEAKLNAVLERIALWQGDSRDVLRAMPPTDAPEVVYVDPMYIPQGKAALVKKEMRICRMLVGDDLDAGELFDAARAVAQQRVVVKRHRQAPPLAPGVSVSLRGHVVRYDVYVTKGPSISTMGA